MKITVRNSFCEKQFYGENGELLAFLRSNKLLAPDKVVLGPDKEIKYLAIIENLAGKPSGENRLYKLLQGDTWIATATPVYDKDANHLALSKPPRPIGLSIVMSSGARWNVERDKKNQNEIHSSEGFGFLSDFSSVRSQMLKIPDGSDVFLWIGIYALIGYMMHEDDIYPV